MILVPELASVEIKTSVARSSLDRAIGKASVDVICCRVGDSTFTDYIPAEHVGQILHQMVLLSVNYVVYVCSAEVGVLSIAVVYCDEETLHVCLEAPKKKAESVASWAHESDPTYPAFVDRETRLSIENRLPFWKIINTYVNGSGPFLPIKIFKHGSQSLYSKTKAGVDGSAQAWAVLRSSTSSLAWEKKIVSQTIKTLAVDAFVAWPMSRNEEMVRTKEDFGDLEHFRESINRVQSLANFIFDVSRELLVYADSLARETTVIDDKQPQVTDGGAPRLQGLPRPRRGQRLKFF